MTQPPRTPIDTNTQLERAVKFDTAVHGRRAENFLAYAGAAQALFVGVLEGLNHYGIIGERVVYDGWMQMIINLPWFNIGVLVLSVAPKTLGRATVGKWLNKLPIVGGNG